LHIGKLSTAFTFGIKALKSATSFSGKNFTNEKLQALFAGMAAHSMLPLHKKTTTAAALVLMLAAHDKGWPIIKGGTQQLANALANYFISLGGEIQTGTLITSLAQLPSAKVVLLDTSVKQLMQIAGERLPSFYKYRLSKFKYGMGVYKIDWALSHPIPFTAKRCAEAATVHLGNSIQEIVLSEASVAKK